MNYAMSMTGSLNTRFQLQTRGDKQAHNLLTFVAQFLRFDGNYIELKYLVKS